MLLEILNSLFGSVIVIRTLSRLENLKLISQKQVMKWSLVGCLPIYFFLFIKEHFLFVFFYIGTFGAILILFEKIIQFYREITFVREFDGFVDRIIFDCRTGKSAKAAFQIQLTQFSNWSRESFDFFLNCKTIANSRKTLSSAKLHQEQLQELMFICESNSHVIDQLISFRSGLKILKKLRHRSSQASLQIRAQAVIAAVLYFFIIILSRSFLNFELGSRSFAVSLSLFISGQIIIFRMGRKIKWTT